MIVASLHLPKLKIKIQQNLRIKKKVWTHNKEKIQNIPRNRGKKKKELEQRDTIPKNSMLKPSK